MKKLVLCALLLGALFYAGQCGAQSRSQDTEAHIDTCLLELAAMHPDFDQGLSGYITTVTFERGRDGNPYAEIKHKYIVVDDDGIGNAAFYLYRSDHLKMKFFQLYKGVKLKPFEQFHVRADVAPAVGEGVYSTDIEICKLSYQLEDERYSKFYVEQTCTDIRFLTQLLMCNELPCLYRRIELVVPDWLKLDVHLLNASPETTSLQQITEGSGKSTYQHYTIEARSLPPLRTETAAPGPTHYYPWLFLQFHGFEGRDKQWVDLFSSNQSVYTWYRSLLDEVWEAAENPVEIKKKRTYTNKGYREYQESLKSVVDPLNLTLDVHQGVDQITSLCNRVRAQHVQPEDQVRYVFEWVRDNIRYIAYEDGIMGYRPDHPGFVIQKGYGDCKGMALLMRTVLKELGFDARLTWVGTSHLSPELAYDFASLANDNHMIVTLELDGDTYILDATDKSGLFGTTPEYLWGRTAMQENGEEFNLIRIPTSSYEDNVLTRTIAAEISDSGLHVDLDMHLKGIETGYWHNGFREELASKDSAAVIMEWAGPENGELQTYDIRWQLDDATADWSLEYVISDREIKQADRLYMPLDYGGDLEELALTEERSAPVEVGFPMTRTTLVHLSIPTDYEVAYLPESWEVHSESFLFEVHLEVSDRTIHVSKRLQFTEAVIPQAEVALLTSALTKLQSFQQDYVIFETP